MNESHRPNLVAYSSAEVEELLAGHVERSFHARQVAAWLVRRHATSFEQMTDLPRELRARLADHFAIRDPEVVTITQSRDGACKYLFRLEDRATVEGVAMPDGAKTTLCLSTQTGCALGCRFCVTGALGGGRNLEADEIIGQFRVMLRSSGGGNERVNIVFMGMGEPLLNTTNLGQALVVLGEQISPRRITVSTAGVVPGLAWLAGVARRPKLAVSLNAPDQERRQDLMPIARRYPLDQLMDALRAFPLEGGRRITFEYVLIEGFNDRPEDPSLLARLIGGLPAKVNLIPFNEDRGRFPDLRQPGVDAVDRFARELRSAGLVVTVRWSRGEDVCAACGQLRGLPRDESGGQPRKASP